MYGGEGRRLEEHKKDLEAQVSAEFEHKHTLRHSGACRGSLGAITSLAILLTLASLMVVNAFSWMLQTALYHFTFTSPSGRSLSLSARCRRTCTNMHVQPSRLQNKEKRSITTHRGSVTSLRYIFT